MTTTPDGEYAHWRETPDGGRVRVRDSYEGSPFFTSGMGDSLKHGNGDSYRWAVE